MKDLLVITSQEQRTLRPVLHVPTLGLRAALVTNPDAARNQQVITHREFAWFAPAIAPFHLPALWIAPTAASAGELTAAAVCSVFVYIR